MFSFRSTVQLVVVACVLLAGSLRQSPVTPSSSIAAAPEVRLRKLHLARPDLILYPIAYEWLC